MIYIIVLLLILFGIIFFDIKQQRYFKYEYYYFLFIVLSLFSGLSYRLGGDTIEYMRSYQYFSSAPRDLFSLDYLMGSDKYMPGWVFLNTLMRVFNADFYVLNLAHSLFVNFAIFLTIKRYSHLPFIAILLYIFTFYIDFNFEILRESIAVSIFLLGVPSLLNKKYRYFIFVLLALLFHQSALILITVPLILLIPLNRRIFTVFLLSIIFIILLIPLVSEFLTSSILKYSLFEAKAKYYFNHEMYGDTIFHKSFIINILLNVVFVYYMLLRFKTYNIQNNFMKLALFYSVTFLLSVIIGIFYRFNNYSLIFFICLLTFIPVFFRTYFRSLVSKTLTVLFFTIYIYFKISTLNNPIGQTSYPSYIRIYPYSSIFDKSKDVKRESFYNSNNN